MHEPSMQPNRREAVAAPREMDRVAGRPGNLSPGDKSIIPSRDPYRIVGTGLVCAGDG